MSGDIDAPATALVQKTQAVIAKVSRLQRDYAGVRRLAQAAQLGEALARTELTGAVRAALSREASLQARLRAQALTANAKGARVSLRRHNRVSQSLDRTLVRLGALGQATVIVRSGVWASRDFRAMAAYASRGADPAAAPDTFFDQAWYLARYPQAAGSGLSPLVHYLLVGSHQGAWPHPLFDEVFYRQGAAVDIAAHSITGLEHYAHAGAALNHSPHPLFDVAHYLGQAPSLATGEAPLAHYLREGEAQGLSPHPLFDREWYAGQAGPGQGLGHYVGEGWRRGWSPHPLFDPAWYLSQNPEVAEADIEPLAHFLTVGGFEGRSPSRWFNMPHYLGERGEARPAQVNPLVDYLRGGAWAVAEARPGFPTAAYIATRPDLVTAGLTPLEHWAREGGG